MQFKPMNDRVLVKRTEESDKLPSGLYIPDSAKKKPIRGKIVAIGNGKLLDGKIYPLDVKTGDEILFGEYSGTEIKIEGEEYLILREDDILAVKA